MKTSPLIQLNYLRFDFRGWRLPISKPSFITHRHRISKTCEICQIHRVIISHSLLSDRRMFGFKFNFHLILGHEPWVDQALGAGIDNGKYTRDNIGEDKSSLVSDRKIKTEGSRTSQGRNEKCPHSLPHKNGGMGLQVFSANSYPIQPTLRSYIRFFNAFELEKPPINQNANLQMDKHACEKTKKISNRNTEKQAQKNTFVSVKEGAAGAKVFSHWLSYSGHNVHYFILYFTTYDPKKLQFFKHLQGLTISSFSPSRRCE